MLLFALRIHLSIYPWSGWLGRLTIARAIHVGTSGACAHDTRRACTTRSGRAERPALYFDVKSSPNSTTSMAVTVYYMRYSKCDDRCPTRRSAVSAAVLFFRTLERTDLPWVAAPLSSVASYRYTITKPGGRKRFLEACVPQSGVRALFGPKHISGPRGFSTGPLYELCGVCLRRPWPCPSG